MGPMRLLVVLPLLALIASCVSADDPVHSSAPDYSNSISLKADEMRTKAAKIALEYSRGSESAEAIATAGEELVRLRIAQASQGLTQSQLQMFLDRQPDERSRRGWRSTVYERAVADVIEFRTDAAKAKNADALTAGAPKAELTPITYETLMERAAKHRKVVLDLPDADEKSPEELGELVADRCCDDIEAHILLARKTRPADSKLSPTEWDAKMRASLRGLVSAMTAAIAAGVREAPRK